LSFLALPFLGAAEPAKEVHINLHSPSYEDGILKTNKGGVLEGDDIRIQAQNIVYVKREEGGKTVCYAKAHGNLMVKYGKKNFVGESIEYNFEDHHGFITEGRTQVGCWFIGGERITLKPDSTYKMHNTSLTTCESGKGVWQLHLKNGKVEDYDILSAQNVQVRVLKVPIFWFPYLKARLTTLKDVPAFYSFTTGGSQGQRISMRYLAYSSRTLKSYLQLDYWFKKGPSGSVQFDYKALEHPTTFQANNFIAYDHQSRVSPSGAPPVSMLRDRFVGELNTKIANKLSINGQYERLSDAFVYETYFNRYYFLFLARHTKVELRMLEKLWLAFLRAEVRINRFQTVDQELPLIYFNLKPLQIGNTGLIFDFTGNVGYLDYVFGSFVDNQFPNFQSSRLELKPKLYRPFKIWGLTITPFGQYVGIGYGQTPLGHPVWNTLGIVGGEANYKLSKIYAKRFRHTIEPYASEFFMTNPTVPFTSHYFFNIDDAYAKINQLRWGIRNYLYEKKEDKITMPLMMDVYTYGLFNNTTIGTYIPRMFVEITQKLPFAYTTFTFAYNFQHNKIDCANVRTAITISEDLAFSFLFMHRSAFYYRKANLDSYLLNVFRSQADLLSSPLSDRRNVVQSKIYWRILRELIVEFESRTGWHRVSSPPYNEMWFNITVLLPCNWKLTFSPQRTISPNTGAKYVWRFQFNLQLGGNPPSQMAQPHIFW
jgi:hypothetical protein